MADKEFSVTKMAAETAFANGTQEFTEHKNNNYKDDDNDSSSSKESEVAIPLSRYKTKLQECAELHHSLQTAHEELSRLKRQVNEQEVSSTETHREVEKLRVLQKMMHEELTVHQTRLRSLLSENDELAAQVHTLQEVCNYQLQTHNKKVRNNDYNNNNYNNNDDKDAQNVDDDNNNKEIANGQSINCLTKLMERAHVNSYRYSMREMSDKLYFATHPAFNHSTFNDNIINSSSSKCSQYIKDIVNKSDSMELEKVKSSLLLSEYVKMSCELNIEPHSQLLTCFYNISKYYTNHTNNNTKNVTEQLQSSVEFDLSLSMVEPPISFAQLSVLEQFLTRPYSCLPSSSSSSEELASIHLLTQAAQHITLRVCEESNEAGIVMFCTRILPHFTRLSELEIYHVNTTCAIKSLVETLSLLRITFAKEDNNIYNNSDTSNNKHAIRYLSLPFLAVNDAALQMLFTMFEQRERLCTSDKHNSTSEKDKERYETEESTNETANNNSAHTNSCVEEKEMLMSEWPLLAMKTLDLSLCTLTDPHTLRSWTSCPLLSCLMLTNCNMLTNSLLHHLLRHLPHLTRLDLSGCMLIDCDGLHFLNSFAHVKVLRLENVPHITQLSLQHIEVLFGTLTCVQQLKMPCVRFLPLPLRNRALISTPGYFVAPRLQQVAIQDMFIDEATLDCLHLCETNTNNKQSIKRKCKDNSGKLNVLQFVNCTFTSDAALATLLEYYKLHNTLHTLTLRNCVGLSSQIVSSLPSSLCKVDVSFTTVITDKALQVLAERCPNLESLNLCGSASLAKDITSDSSDNDNNEINYTALSEVGLRCLLSFSHLHTLNLLQLPSLPNDVIVMLIYALPSLKLLYHETVAISHLLNAKGELECKLRYTLNAKEKQLYDSCKNGNNNKDNENNSCYLNDIKFVNQNAQYSQLQIHRKNTNNNNSEHMRSKDRNNVECFESESSSVRLMLNESEWHSKEIRICTLRDLLRCRQSVELMTENEHQQPAFLMNPAMLTHPSIEYVNRKFAPETKNNEINANYSDNVNSDEAVTHSIHDERQKRPESAASSSSTSEMSMTLEEEEEQEEEDDRIEHSEQALEINNSNNTNSTTTNTNTKANKSGKRVSFIVSEQGSKTAVQSENDKAMTRARNRAMRHNKMRQRENSDTSSSSSISSEANNTSKKIKNYNGIKGNNNSDTVTKTDVVSSEIGP